MSDAPARILPGPLGDLPTETQEKIRACIPPEEITPQGAISPRGMVAMMEGVKKYGPPELTLLAALAIPQLLKAEKEFQRRQRGPHCQKPRRKKKK